MNDETPEAPLSMPADHRRRHMAPPARRPLGSTLVAWGFILISVLALMSMGRHLLHGRFSIHFGVLLFPVALGLFTGRVSAIFWARVQAGFMMALGGIPLLLYPFIGAGYNVHWFGHPLQGVPRHLLVVAVASITISLGIAIWRAVGSRAHLAYVASRGGFPPFPESELSGQSASAE